MTTAQTKIYLTVGEKSMSATLVNNSATQKLVSLLSKSPITIVMNEYGGFEKAGTLLQSLPTSNSHITTIPGDIMFYQGRNVVIFYGLNSWSYTRLGKIDGATTISLREFLGIGDITLEMSLSPTSGINEFSANSSEDKIVYDLNGRIVKTRPLHSGIYIINNRKVLIK